MTRQVFLALVAVLFLLIGCSTQEDLPLQTQDSFTEFVEDETGAMLPAETQAIEVALTDKNPADDGFYQMVKDVGGFAAYSQRLASSDDNTLIQLHKRYGIDFTRGMPEILLDDGGLSPQAISDCVRFLPVTDRNRVFNISGHTIFIDGVGRPGFAELNFGRNDVLTPAPRTACQTVVGTWGNPGDVGGHLIASALGGYGGRGNLVPQNGIMNNTVWRRLENLVRRCAASSYRGSYLVTPQYADATSVRPSHMQAYLALFRRFIPIIPAVAGTLRLPNRTPGPTEIAATEGFILNFTPYCTRIVGLIIDDTGSMGSQIGAVKASLSNYIADVPEEQDTLWNLTTFKDSVSNQGTTEDLSTIQGWVNGLSASGGADCPEEVLGAISSGISTLNAHPDRGKDLIVVTDASAQPGDVSGIIAAADLDDVRVSVLLSGDCGEPTPAASSTGLETLNHSYFLSSQIVLKQIADATGGKYYYIPGGTQEDYEMALDEIFESIESPSGDTTPPSISLSTDTAVLWPPDHKMREIQVDIVVEDDTDPEPSVELVSVISTEPLDGQGDGNTTDDILIDETGTIYVRAERSGSGNDRIYTITYKATDASDNVGYGSLDILVPHDQGN